MLNTEVWGLRDYDVEWILVPSRLQMGGALEAKLSSEIHVCALRWEGL